MDHSRTHSRDSVVLKPAMLLNWDIILEVMSWSERGDISRMSRTCKTLLKVSPQFLLVPQPRGPQHQRDRRLFLGLYRRPPTRIVALKSASQLESLHEYIFGGRHDCIRYFKQLELTDLNLWKWYERARARELLGDFLTKATELRSLHLTDCALFFLGPPVRRALTRNTSLRTIQILSDVDRLSAVALLKKFKAPLTGIDINFDHCIHLRSPLPILEHFSDTLRAVTLTFVNFDNILPCELPRVTTLELDHCDLASPIPLWLCFPNLQDLHVHVMNDYGVDVESRRQTSLQLQARRAHRQWRSLRRLIGHTVTLYALGLRCAVTHVDVTECEIGYEEHDSARLAAMLADFRPTSLHLDRVLVQTYRPRGPLLGLAEHLAPARDQLRELKLTLECWSLRREDPRPYINALVDALPTAGLRVLDVAVVWTTHLDGRNPNIDPRDPLAQQAWDAAAEEVQVVGKPDLVAVARHAVQALPSLKLVAVGGEGHIRGRELFEACDAEGQGGRGLVKLEENGTVWKEAHASIMYKPEWDAHCRWYWDE